MLRIYSLHTMRYELIGWENNVWDKRFRQKPEKASCKDYENYTINPKGCAQWPTSITWGLNVKLRNGMSLSIVKQGNSWKPLTDSVVKSFRLLCLLLCGPLICWDFCRSKKTGGLSCSMVSSKKSSTFSDMLDAARRSHFSIRIFRRLQISINCKR